LIQTNDVTTTPRRHAIFAGVWAAKISNGLTYLREIWQGDANWPSKGYGQLKFRTFNNPRWRTAAIFKNKKRPYFGNGLTDRHEI